MNYLKTHNELVDQEKEANEKLKKLKLKKRKHVLNLSRAQDAQRHYKKKSEI